jgi:hypothetical protein
MAERALRTCVEYITDNRIFRFALECERAVVRDLGVIAVSLSSLYVFHRWLGHPRSDQGIYDITTIKLN